MTLAAAYSAHALAATDDADADADATLLALLQVAAFASDALMALPQEDEFAALRDDWQQSIDDHESARRGGGARVWVLDFLPDPSSARRNIVGACSAVALVHNAPGSAVTQPPVNMVDDDGGATVMEGHVSLRWYEFDMAILAVLPAHEGRGGATALVGLVEREAAKYPRSCVTLDVASSRYPRARLLYERLGYRVWRDSDVPGQEHKMVKIVNASSSIYAPAPVPAPVPAQASAQAPGADKRRRIALDSLVARELCARADCTHVAAWREATPGGAAYCSPACQSAHHAMNI